MKAIGGRNYPAAFSLSVFCQLKQPAAWSGDLVYAALADFYIITVIDYRTIVNQILNVIIERRSTWAVA